MTLRKSLIFLTSISLLWDTDLRPIFHHLIGILVNIYADYVKSFFFDPVTPSEIEREILSIPLNNNTINNNNTIHLYSAINTNYS